MNQLIRTALPLIGWIALTSTMILLTTFTWSNNNFRHEKLIPKRVQNFTSNPKQLRLDDQPNHLFWFVQISEIGIGIDSEAERVHDFAKFVTETLDTIKPSVVLASGDLTEQGQDVKKWKIYNETLAEGNVRNKTQWLDLRGENDISESSMMNSTFFERYSVQGSQHKRSYIKLVPQDGDLYSFIAVDAFPKLRPKFPFNKGGMLTGRDQDELHELQEESRKAGADYTIWFGHYPISEVITPKEGSDGLRRIISNHENSLAYMCGHLYFLGWIPHKHTLQNNSFLELGVADWVDNRGFRVAAIDNGLLSFVDVRHGDWPIILITNPKNVLFQLPNRQEAKLQLESTHIRLLAFSPAGIKSCVVQIDNDFKAECNKVNDNLFVVEWDPEKYKDGIHYITATVVDDDGQENQVTQPFRLDDKQSLSFDFLARLILETDWDTIVKCEFYAGIMIIFVIEPWISLRIQHQLITAGFLSPRKTDGPPRFFPILISINRIFWPIALYFIYISIGPWGICEFNGEYGVLFIWGVDFSGTSFPVPQNYLFALMQLAWNMTFFIDVLPNAMRSIISREPVEWINKHFYFFIAIQIFMSCGIGISFGYSIWLGPFILWPIIMSISFYRFLHNVPKEQLMPAFYVWNGGEEPSTVSQLKTNTVKRKIDRILRKLSFYVEQKKTIIQMESTEPGT